MSKIVRDNYTRPISVNSIYHVYDVFRLKILVRNDYSAEYTHKKNFN